MFQIKKAKIEKGEIKKVYPKIVFDTDDVKEALETQEILNNQKTENNEKYIVEISNENVEKLLEDEVITIEREKVKQWQFKN